MLHTFAAVIAVARDVAPAVIVACSATPTTRLPLLHHHCAFVIERKCEQAASKPSGRHRGQTLPSSPAVQAAELPCPPLRCTVAAAAVAAAPVVIAAVVIAASTLTFTRPRGRPTGSRRLLGLEAARPCAANLRCQPARCRERRRTSLQPDRRAASCANCRATMPLQLLLATAAISVVQLACESSQLPCRTAAAVLPATRPCGNVAAACDVAPAVAVACPMTPAARCCC